MQILTPRIEEIKKSEQLILNRLKQILISFDVSEMDIQALIEAIEQLDELFLLVVVGEFNSGKSAFINALLGDNFLEEGVTPTTNNIYIVRYGNQESINIVNENLKEVVLPIEFLKEIRIVDTPGTNAIIRAHEELTTNFIPRSDLVLFITSVDRPFTQSEREFLETIHDWGKKIVFVINKIDLLQNSEDISQIIEFVRTNAYDLIGSTPEVFPLSSRLALSAKKGNPKFWLDSQFEMLETFIQDTLDEKNRIKIKLFNPVGVGIHLSKRYLEIVNSRLDVLQEDISMLSKVDDQLDIYRDDMNKGFSLRMTSVENILYEMEKRGTDYFDDKFRLVNFFELISKDKVAYEFEAEVISDLPQRIETNVTELIDWLVDSDLRQWQAVNEHIIERRKTHQDQIVGKMGLGTFHYDRERLISAVGKEAQKVVDSYDKNFESNAIAESAQAAVAASAAIEIGAVGLGTAVAILASTASADITGILLASVVATLGLFVIPARRKMAKDELREKISALRKQLSQTLSSQFEGEIVNSTQRIEGAIAPYTRFVRAEKKNLTTIKDNLSQIVSELLQLQDKINKI